MKVILTPHVSLRMVAQRVESFDDSLMKTVKEMFETMREENGVGLAAPQVGLSQRVIVISEKGEKVLINPTIKEFSSDTCGYKEGCLSIPGKRLNIVRPSSVVVEYQNLDGSPVIEKLDGLKARIVQHEIDHLDGILMIDRVKT